MATKFGEVGVVSYFVDMISDHAHKKEIGIAISNYDREVEQIIEKNSYSNNHDLILQDV